MSNYHGVVIYGEDSYRKKVVFHLSALKPEAEMVSEASRGHNDFDKPDSRVDTDVLMEVAYSCNFLAVSDSSTCPDIGTR